MGNLLFRQEGVPDGTYKINLTLLDLSIRE